jgi:hypothetical protein
MRAGVRLVMSLMSDSDRSLSSRRPTTRHLDRQRVADLP